MGTINVERAARLKRALKDARDRLAGGRVSPQNLVIGVVEADKVLAEFADLPEYTEGDAQGMVAAAPATEDLEEREAPEEPADAE